MIEIENNGVEPISLEDKTAFSGRENGFFYEDTSLTHLISRKAFI